MNVHRVCMRVYAQTDFYGKLFDYKQIKRKLNKQTQQQQQKKTITACVYVLDMNRPFAYFLLRFMPSIYS